MSETLDRSVIHIAAFRVRHYECDAYGHLNNANYIRYMEEAAFEASASVGYPRKRYQTLSRVWLARETQITYLQPVLWQYEFYKAGQRVAHASTDWVYLEADSLRPAMIPPDMIRAFMPEGTNGAAAPSQRFPELPPPPAGIFKLLRRVEWRDIDTARHVNNAVYFNYIEDCGMQVAVAFGWPLTRTERDGFGVIAREHHIEYQSQAVLDDELEIATWAAPRSRTFLHNYPSARQSAAGAGRHPLGMGRSTDRPSDSHPGAVYRRLRAERGGGVRCFQRNRCM